MLIIFPGRRLSLIKSRIHCLKIELITTVCDTRLFRCVPSFRSHCFIIILISIDQEGHSNWALYTEINRNIDVPLNRQISTQKTLKIGEIAIVYRIWVKTEVHHTLHSGMQQSCLVDRTSHSMHFTLFGILKQTYSMIAYIDFDTLFNGIYHTSMWGIFNIPLLIDIQICLIFL